MSRLILGILFIILTVLIFYLSKKLYHIIPTPFTLPIFITSLFFVLLLIIFDIPYQTYMIGGQWLDHFLGPLVVALALPLYRQRHLVKKYATTIFIGVAIGSIIGVTSGIVFAKWFSFEEVIIQSIAPKSVTTPVALSIADSVGGNMTIAAIGVMIAGIGGAMFAPLMLRIFRIDHPVARGLGIGTASHAIGTAKALELGELDGAISALAMTITAITVSIIAPFLLQWLL